VDEGTVRFEGPQFCVNYLSGEIVKGYCGGRVKLLV